MVYLSQFFGVTSHLLSVICREEELRGTNEAADAMLCESFADYESGGYSPQYLSQSQLDPGTFVVNEEDDLQRLVFARMQVQGTGSRVEVSMITIILYLLGCFIRAWISMQMHVFI